MRVAQGGASGGDIFSTMKTWGTAGGEPCAYAADAPEAEAWLARLVGDWAVRRAIVDRRGMVWGRFRGEAAFGRAGPRADAGLRYRETGHLRYAAAAPMAAERAYLWQAAGREVAVAYGDGRPFHSFRLAGDRAEAVHLCGADRYRVAYEFGAWPEWSATWHVTGPRKDYVMRTRYRPM